MPQENARFLKEFQTRPEYLLSDVIHAVEGRTTIRLADHKPRLDQLVETFDNHRVSFGSDWPNNEFTTSIEQVLLIMRECDSSKPLETAQNHLWKNSCRAYKWAPRAARQPRFGG